MSETDGVPSFDFGPLAYYEPTIIGERVVWPLVDAKWGKDWWSESEDGDLLSLPAHGMRGGKKWHVCLVAETEEWPDPKDTSAPYRLHHAKVTVEKELDGSARTKALIIARNQAAINAAKQEDQVDEDDEEYVNWDWPKGNEDDFSVRLCAYYSFDTDLNWELSHYHSIIAPSGAIEVHIIHPDEEAGDIGTNDYIEDRIYSADLDNIQAACYILRAPDALHSAIKAVRARPIYI